MTVMPRARISQNPSNRAGKLFLGNFQREKLYIGLLQEIACVRSNRSLSVFIDDCIICESKKNLLVVEYLFLLDTTANVSRSLGSMLL